MGLALRREPAFREAFERCDAIVQALRGTSLVDVIEAGPLDHTRWTQPATVALGIALTATWRAWGIVMITVGGAILAGFLYGLLSDDFDLNDWWPISLVIWLAVIAEGIQKVRTPGERRS